MTCISQCRRKRLTRKKETRVLGCRRIKRQYDRRVVKGKNVHKIEDSMDLSSVRVSNYIYSYWILEVLPIRNSGLVFLKLSLPDPTPDSQTYNCSWSPLRLRLTRVMSTVTFPFETSWTSVTSQNKKKVRHWKEVLEVKVLLSLRVRTDTGFEEESLGQLVSVVRLLNF